MTLISVRQSLQQLVAYADRTEPGADSNERVGKERDVRLFWGKFDEIQKQLDEWQKTADKYTEYMDERDWDKR